ncbi:MAG: TAT-dependent nitrous-oxide reductase, partial [Acidobacteriota bacterium]|nr:TAT-dependent nitrous-oxide reductase [Acidobacteriota bacterium]
KYYAFLSGGQSGAVYVYGLPSGRYIRSIPVYEPRAGYGYANVPGTETYEMLAASGPMWGDTHHPILSESGGDYDGKHLWINDKANSRIARIDLRTFETKAIARIPNLQATHGIAVVSPDTSYIVANGEFQAEIPQGRLDTDSYGAVMAFLDPMTLEPRFEVLMPGNCDINDSSKDGRWAFTTIYNLENAVTVEGMIQREEDAIGAVDIHAAEAALERGEFREINGVKVIDPTETTEKVLYVIPVPKNPHGCDVTPDGKYVLGAGKLSPTVTVIDISKIDQVENPRDAIAGQPDVGLGPLHTTFDGRGNAYTSLFVDSQIVKWNIEKAIAGDPTYVIDRVDVHYNVGHTQATLAETMHPTGEYLLALNKLSKDQYLPVGPTMPEAQELIDITGEKMTLLSSFPAEPEPHDAVFMLAEDLSPKVVQTEELTADAVPEDGSRVERVGPDEVHVYMTAIRSKYGLNDFTVKEGDKVTITLTNIETIRDMSHGFAVEGYGINLALDPGQTRKVTFVADKPGTHWYYCTWFCSALHLEMRGRMLVEERG